jgi:hypothetical protein
MRRLAAALAASCVLVGSLAGCSLFRSKDTRACPRAGIVQDLATMPVYREGPTRDLTDLRYTASLAGLDGGCRFTSRGVEVDMTVAVIGERGPALERDTVDVEYFVAIAGPGQKVLNEETFRTTLDFHGGKTRTGSKEELVERIPLPKGADGEDYFIAVGFRLSPEQVEANRRKRGG